ncbi:MAG: dTDP-4-dehydrorhamnose reductase [Pseudomonadota bacterium]
MRLLIAGSHGQIALALLEQTLQRDSVRVCAIGRPALDLCTSGSLLSAMTSSPPDVVINAAAYTAVDQAETNEDDAFQLNCEGARRLAIETWRRQTPIIQLSTDYVFDGSKASPYEPNDRPEPINAYGRTKLAGEVAVRHANPHHTIIRTGWIYSPFGTNFVKTMMRLALERDEIRVVDDQLGTPTYAPHLAAALLDVAEKVHGDDHRESFGVFHVAGTGEATWADIAREVFRVSKSLGGPSAAVVPMMLADNDRPAARPVNARLNCSAAQQQLGVQLPAWQEGVRACVTRLLRSEK